MNIRTQYLGWLLLLVLTGSSCKKWLDVNPKSNVTEQKLFESEQGFKDALTGVYVQLGARPYYGKEFTMAFMDVIAQNYNITSNFHNYYNTIQYNYKDVNTRLKIDSFWICGYKAIANINNILEAIDGKKGIFSGNNYRIVKGEALGLRALLHFDLLRAFGPIPAAGNAATAIPYMTKFAMNIEPSKTASEVMELCMKDLNEATELLSVNKTLVNGVEDGFLSYTRNHFNYWAVTGLKARISLWRGDLPNAYTWAKEVIDANVFPWVSSTALSTITLASRTFHTEHLFSVYISNLKDINTEIFRASSGNNLLNTTTAKLNTRFDVASGGSTDFRYVFLWKTDGSTSTKFPAKYLIDDLQYVGVGRGEYLLSAWRKCIISLLKPAPIRMRRSD
ncbi:RagB/SusD family nutrient uptake outer membrane protein [Pseudobacter ginsenosidimutans]|uniref:RagB/SusD family nutrient uptake outer membrane protein n=1 Tax=Pseudobacter ginsenosidimutans TaxID=661488 RepID=UPI0011BBCE4A|nr:RagB/SusD family nutrient uptake outer membrane protein [Pseudobacter ginsenosidimutans]QEC44364.1 RagB/SusD family nutrient uptake outer membrane protein [Pseudobacter ginsenosidimutans]